MVERSINVALAASGLVLLGPAALCFAVIVYLVDGRPVLVPDLWIDRRGRSITLSAFRTYRIRAASRGVDLPLPWLGWYLQRSGLEKLPRLWNILGKGKTLQGIYRFEGGRLTVCLPEGRQAEEGRTRPEDFGGGQGMSLFVLERIRDH
jgi:hypothetical protein